MPVDRIAGHSTHTVLQHQLLLLLSPEPQLEGGRSVGDAIEPLFGGLCVRLGTGPPIGCVACGRTDGVADKFYRDAFRDIDALKPAGVSVSHSFQTNGMLIDDAWCDLLIEEDVGVGVSIDGPKHLHDRNRLTRSGQGTFDRTIAGVRQLRQRGCHFMSSPCCRR